METLKGFAALTPLLAALVMLSVVPAGVRAGEPAAPDGPRVVLAIHGGVGTIDRDELAPKRRAEYEEALKVALNAGFAALGRDGGTSLDAVEAAIRSMEDSPLFNAGRGAVFTSEGRNELDASIMEGRDHKAGAVASVTRIKNPISAARAVMERSPHVLMIGPGAERFAVAQGLEEVSPLYFWTERRWKELRRALDKEQARRGSPDGGGERHLGTVGAVALDRAGDLAAGTSTGGMTGKRFGRVGDSPIIGAGTYADNRACAISATGHGEFFIRFAVAHDIVARVRYLGEEPARAADALINGTLKPLGAEGGVIILDARGRYAAAFNTNGMYRGYVTEDGTAHVAILAD